VTTVVSDFDYPVNVWITAADTATP